MIRTYWHDDNLPIAITLDKLLYDIRKDDGIDGLVFDAVTMADIIEDDDGRIALDAMLSPYNKLETKMSVLQKVMERAGTAIKPLSYQLSEPFTQNGTANVACIFELSDGQTISVFFHNPDTTPKKILPTDEMVSWKWLLNKKDITIVVAPEKGKDLNVRQVATRLMKLAEKNSAGFQRQNSKRAEKMQAIEGLKTEIAGLEQTLSDKQKELELVKFEAEEWDSKASPFYTRIEKIIKLLEKNKNWNKNTSAGNSIINADATVYVNGIFNGTAIDWHIQGHDPETDILSRLIATITDNSNKPLNYIANEIDRYAAEERDANQASNQPQDSGIASGSEQTVSVEQEQTIDQWDSEKEAVVLSEMIASAKENAQSIDSVARQFIKEKLQGRIFETKAGKCIVNSMSAGKLVDNSGRKGSLKLKAIPYIPEILTKGDPGQDEPLRDKISNTVEKTSITSFVPLTHIFDAGDVKLKVMIKLGRREAYPALVYSLSASDYVMDSTQEERAYHIAYIRQPSENDSIHAGLITGSDSIMDNVFDSVNDMLNIDILEAWDAEGNPIDLEDDAQQPVAPEPAATGIDPIAKSNIEAANISAAIKKKAIAYLNANPDDMGLRNADLSRASKVKIATNIKDLLIAEVSRLSEYIKITNNVTGLWKISIKTESKFGYLMEVAIYPKGDTVASLCFDSVYTNDKGNRLILDAVSSLNELKQANPTTRSGGYYALPFDLDVKAFVANVIKPVVDEFLSKQAASEETPESSKPEESMAEPQPEAVEPITDEEAEIDDTKSPEDLITAPDGTSDFGEINQEIAAVIKRQAGKIKLQVGEHLGKNKGYGIVHIQESHPEITNPVEFVKDVATNFVEIWKTKSGRLILVKRKADNTGDVSVVQLVPSHEDDFYSVVTAYKSRNPDGETLLWNATHAHPDDSGNQPALQSEHQEAASDDGKSAERKEADQTITNPQPNATADIEAEIESLRGETDRKVFDKRLDDLAAMIEERDLMEQYDPQLNELADILTEILKKAAAGVM